MARHTFGGTIADFAASIGPGGTLRAVPATLTFWDAETGGTQITDLLLDGAAVSTIAVPVGGQIPDFQGPDEVTELWADAGGGRVRMVAEGRQGPVGPEGPSGPALPEAQMAELATTFGRATRGNLAVIFGDSISVASDTVGGGVVDHATRAISPLTYGSILTQQRLRYVRNASLGGDTSTEALARWDADVEPYDFSMLIVALGTNDSAESAPLATYSANIEEIAARTRRKGAELVLCTVPPNNNVSATPANRKTLILTYNLWLCEYAATHGHVLVDYYNLLVDPANGNYLSAYYGDGTHPGNAGYYAMGDLLASTLDPHLAPVAAPLVQDNTDPTCLATQPLFLGALNASGVPSGWTVAGSVQPAGVTATLDSSDTTIKGNWYTLTISGLAASSTTFQTIGGVIAGNRYRLSGRIDTSSLVNTTVMARLLFNGSTATGYQFRAMSTLPNDLPDGVFLIEGVAPADATSVQLNLQVTGTSGSSGVVKFAQVGVRDLTALGLA